MGRRPRMPACTRRLGWSLSAGQGARAECTLNISPMILTRDVSKFTGWLNAVAACRGGGYDGKVSLGAGRMRHTQAKARLES